MSTVGASETKTIWSNIMSHFSSSFNTMHDGRVVLLLGNCFGTTRRGRNEPAFLDASGDGTESRGDRNFADRVSKPVLKSYTA